MSEKREIKIEELDRLWGNIGLLSDQVNMHRLRIEKLEKPMDYGQRLDNFFCRTVYYAGEILYYFMYYVAPVLLLIGIGVIIGSAFKCLK